MVFNFFFFFTSDHSSWFHNVLFCFASVSPSVNLMEIWKAGSVKNHFECLLRKALWMT